MPERWVIKIGSALLTNDGAGLDRKAIDSWVEQICPVAESGQRGGTGFIWRYC